MGRIIAGLAVLGLSFWITLIVIDSADQATREISLADVPLTDDDGTPRVSHPTAVRDLPPPPSGSPFGAGWDGVDGLNVRVVGLPPTPGGTLALSLVATRAASRHRIGMQFVHVPSDVPVRTIGWVRVPEGIRIGVDIRDGQPPGGQPANGGAALFDPTARKVVSVSGNVQASLEPGPGDWHKLVMQIRSSDGVLVMYVGFAGPADAAVFSGGGQQMIFGGVEIAPG